MLNRRSLIAGMTASIAAPTAWAQEKPVFYANDGTAIQGYDTVSYFVDGSPVPGKPDIAVKWKGAMWHFASQKNREAFESNPRAFAPQFGGYCAYAMAQGFLSKTDPNTWLIVEDRLYLIHSQQIERIWHKNLAENIQRAEENWPRVLYK